MTNNNIKKEVKKGKIVVTKITKSPYKKKNSNEPIYQAELKQTITTTSYYPEKAVATNLQDNIFKTEDFGYSSEPFVNKEVRVTWFNVPKGATVEEVQELLDNDKDAYIYKILANKPILDDSQKYAVKIGNVTLDHYANKQVVRYPEGSENAGEIALYNDKVQYRATFFTNSGKEDNDLRTEVPNEQYVSDEIKEELEEDTVQYQEAIQDLNLEEQSL